MSVLSLCLFEYVENGNCFLVPKPRSGERRRLGAKAIRGARRTAESDMRTSPPMRMLAAAFSFGVVLAVEVGAGESLTIAAVPGPTALTLRLPDNVAAYYRLDLSTSLPVFAPWAMDLGDQGTEWKVSYDLGPEVAFFRVFGQSLWAPTDTDGDGMDDVWELDHPGLLNPLDATDAGLDPDGNGLTHLQEYWQIYGRRMPRNEAISRELTLFNFESPLTRFEAISREITLHNLPVEPMAPEAISREITLYRGERAPHPDYHDAISRAVTLYNAPPESVFPEAISREVTLYQGERAPLADHHDTISRAVTLFNFESPLTAYEAISREVSLFNGELGGP